MRAALLLALDASRHYFYSLHSVSMPSSVTQEIELAQ